MFQGLMSDVNMGQRLTLRLIDASLTSVAQAGVVHEPRSPQELRAQSDDSSTSSLRSDLETSARHLASLGPVSSKTRHLCCPCGPTWTNES